jgi:hypothetical protein
VLPDHLLNRSHRNRVRLFGDVGGDGVEDLAEVLTHLFEVDIGRCAVLGTLPPLDLGLDGACADVVVEAQHSLQRLARDRDVPLGRRLVGVGVHDRGGRAALVVSFEREVRAIVVHQDDLGELPSLQQVRQLRGVAGVGEGVAEDPLGELHLLDDCRREGAELRDGPFGQILGVQNELQLHGVTAFLLLNDSSVVVV